MKEYVFIPVGRKEWHIDGSFQPTTFPYSLYHMVCVPLKGDIVFAPLNEIVDNLPFEKRNEWERQWMMSGWRTGPIHPLIYPHPSTKKKANFKNGYFVLFCVFSEFLNHWSCFLKPTRNVQSIRLQCSWEPMKSHHNIQCRSLIQPKYHYFSSYFLPILINLPHLVTSL